MPKIQEINNFYFFTVIVVVLLNLCSCTSSRKFVYFNTLKDTIYKSGIKEIQPIIQKNDLLSISVSSLNPEATLVFNMPNVQQASNSVSATLVPSSSQITGYLVNTDGTIQFPILGTLRVEGLTKKQLTDTLVKQLVSKKLLVDPIINIRFLNYRVTVMGEVAKPTVINVANERISLLEALGLAGDLTIFAKRDNILIIRDENGDKIVKRIDLNSNEIFNSPYYYLKTNDIIYVEPNNAKIASASNTRQILPIVLSSLSFIAIILTRVF